jgi:hypothetical protein
MAAFFLAAIGPLAYLSVTGLAPLRNGPHIPTPAWCGPKGFNMELFVSTIACLLFVPPVAIAFWTMVRVVRDVRREESAFYATRARQHGKG